MRALSLIQPWATLVALGAKRYETRSWKVSYRGPVAIHASRGLPKECRALCDVWPFNKYIRTADELPRGVIIALAELPYIYSTEVIARALNPERQLADAEELRFGDYSTGRFAWQLVNVRALKTPVDAWGNRGLWKVDPETEKMVLRSLEL